MKQKWSVLSSNALSKLFLYTSSTIVAINFTFNFNSPQWLPSSPIVAQARFITFDVGVLPTRNSLCWKKKSKTNQQTNKPKRKEVEMKELRWYAEYEGNAIRENLLRTFLLPVVSCDSRSSSVSLTSSSFQRACKGLRKVCMGWSGAWGVWGGEGGRLDTEGPFGNSVDVCRLVLKVLILPKTKTYNKFSFSHPLSDLVSDSCVWVLNPSRSVMVWRFILVPNFRIGTISPLQEPKVMGSCS